MRFEPQACVCGEAIHEELYEAGDTNFASTGEAAVICRCATCRSIYPQRFPDEASLCEAYAGYYTFDGDRRSIWSRFADLFRRSYMDREAPRTGAILDYGCGSGAYLARLTRTRPEANRFGTDLHRLNSARGFSWVDRDTVGSRGFRHITLSHVLEHVHDPAALLGKLAGALGREGTIWISTPNARSFLIDAFGPYARDIDFPRHRVLLTREALESMAQRAGLTVTWRSSPLVNTLLNALQCVRNVLSAPDRLSRLARAAWVALCWCGRADREPELVALMKAA